MLESVNVDYTALNLKGAPVRQLKALKKVHLAAGEEKEVTISLDENAFGLFDENGEWKLNPGNYKVYIGNQQPVFFRAVSRQKV